MKLKKQSTRKIDISLINETSNIRKQYNDIEQLARSIERDGQLQPIGVIELEDGTYNMLYGFRRLNAYKFLLNEKKDYNQIEAKITSGDPAIIQLIENIHRDNLKPAEFEDALQTLIDSGLNQKEIAERLNIRLTRVSDVLAARNLRKNAESKNIDTSNISTSAMSVMRSVPEEKKEETIKKVKNNGGTVKAAKEAIKEIKTTNQIIEINEKMKCVIIESPFRGDGSYSKEQYILYAKKCLLDSLKRNEAPFASHLLYTQILDDDIEDQRKLGMQAGFAWYSAADYCIVYEDFGISKGMQAGIAYAKKSGLQIVYRRLSNEQRAL